MNRTLAACVALMLCGRWADAAAAPARIDYTRDIKPVLRDRCYACHGVLKQKGSLRLDTVTLMRAGGNTGPAVVPGQVDDSLLLDRVSEPKESRRMPPEGPPLAPAQIAALRLWVQQGAAAPADEKPEPDPRSHWAFRTLARPAVPAGSHHNPVDRFPAEGWRRHGLTPAATADRATLVRRLYLDLLGVPPTREQLRAHLADTSPFAYERLVDQLLASPAYGE